MMLLSWIKGLFGYQPKSGPVVPDSLPRGGTGAVSPVTSRLRIRELESHVDRLAYDNLQLFNENQVLKSMQRGGVGRIDRLCVLCRIHQREPNSRTCKYCLTREKRLQERVNYLEGQIIKLGQERKDMADKLQKISNALDKATGDTDPFILKSWQDEEIFDMEPMFWATQNVNTLLCKLKGVSGW